MNPLRYYTWKSELESMDWLYTHRYLEIEWKKQLHRRVTIFAGWMIPIQPSDTHWGGGGG